jgi:palmitoyltransferase ZDHHC9/14/18
MSSHPGDSAFPSPAAQSEAGDAGSILSSRMTDIASDDGRDQTPNANPTSKANQLGRRPSTQTTAGDGASRPNTAVTGVSSQRNAWSQAPSSRRGFVSAAAPQRGSIPGSIASSSTTRPPSAKTHVPLASHAFFRPMSSQRLQAQRGGSRTINMSQQMSEDGSVEGGNGARTSIVSSQPERQGTIEDGEGRPASRGTEVTEQGTTDRRTATTSPTQGYYQAGSITDSVRPLQRNPGNTKGLTLNLDTGYKNGGLPTPSKSPHSFRSGFLLAGRGNPGPDSPKRSTQGREKLSSVTSSPALTPTDAPKGIIQKPDLGRNYKYFTGNTVFCWGGRLQNTRHKPVNVATGLMVLIPGVLFFAFSAPWLWHNVSPALPIVFAYLFYICLSSFIHASVSDPGVSPPFLAPDGLNSCIDRCRFCLETSIRCLRQMKMRIR